MFIPSGPQRNFLPLCTLLFTLLVSVLGCNKGESTRVPCCDPAAEPIYLSSKLDDDDGDGIFTDEDFPNIDDEDDDISDHTWVRDDSGLFHLFFQTEDKGFGSHIEHYTSTNLRSLDYVGTALWADPAGWDNYSLWSPCVIKFENTYYMFYTGATGRGNNPTTKQRIGLATSPDLMTWTRYPGNHCPGTSGDGCLYECGESWTTWDGPNDSYNQQCRDPFVIWDETEQRWLLFATAKSTNGFAVVTVAQSTDLLHWTGAGYIDATRRLASGTGAQTTGGQAENPHVMSHDGTRFLIFTDWFDTEDSVSVENPRTIAQYATSTSLAVDSVGSANWTYRGYIPDPAVNAIEVQRIGTDLWIMSQSISNQRAGVPEHRRHLRLKCVVWQGSFSFDTANAVLPCTSARAAGVLSVGVSEP